MAAISIQNLIKRTQSIQARMNLGAVKQASSSTENQGHLVEDLTYDLRETASRIRLILANQGRTAADLPIRTRRAYQWVAYLGLPDNLITHLDALGRVNLFLPKYLSNSRLKKLKLSFYHLGSLYKISEKAGIRDIIIQESFIHAPDRIITAVLETALARRDGSARKLIQDYTFTPAYQAARTHLEYLEILPGAYTRGDEHDLDASFQRVNQDYFQAGLTKPHLVWSSRLTYRKFGHYQWDIDTVMISKSLDKARIPSYVIDYVMYHELLHKKLGTRQVNSRRLVHTAKFRTAEDKFQKITEAKKQLQRLSQKRS
jgi:hypothetical protein